MASRTRTAPPTSMATPILLAGVAGAVVGVMYGIPPMVVLWFSAVAAAWMEPPPNIAGRDGRPVGQQEHFAAQRYQAAKSCRAGLFGLSGGVLPIPPNVPWVLAVLVGTVAWGVPLHPAPQLLKAVHGQWPSAKLRLADAVAGFLVVAAPVHAWRATHIVNCPGVSLKTLPAAWRSKPVVMLLGAVLGLAAGLAAGIGATRELGSIHRQVVDPLPEMAAIAALGLIGGMYAVWRADALRNWAATRQAWHHWEPIWRALKTDPPPALLSHSLVGPAVLDLFSVPQGATVAEYIARTPKISAALGAGVKVAVLPAPDEVDGEPVMGSPHPSRFTVVQWPIGQIPDMGGDGTSPQVASYWAWCAFVWALSPRGYGTPMPLAFPARHNGGWWESKWSWPDGPSLLEIRPMLDELGLELRCRVLIDHRKDVVYFGTLPDDNEDLVNLSTEDRWEEHWSSVLKKDANHPVVRHETYAERETADGATVSRQGFLTRLGDDPTSYRGLEPKLATALDGARYVSVGSWKGQSPGERHPQAFAVYWSMSPVPSSPTDLADSSAAQWILSGVVDRAFDAAKLPRPMLVKSACLTHGLPSIWRMQLRLLDGVTPGDIQAKLSKMAESLGCPFVQVDSESSNECMLYAGARPADVVVKSPGIATSLMALEWGQAWRAAKITGPNGAMMRLVSHGTMDTNPDVEVLDFDVPAGVDPRSVKSALPPLGVARGYAFVASRPSPNGPSSIRILASRKDPLPAFAPVDWEDSATTESVPFAVGVDGTPIRLNTKENPHLLVAGLTGAGKSSCVATLVYGFLSAGAELYVVDPQKGAADFAWADRWTTATGTTLDESVAVLHGIYGEVTERVKTNASAAKTGQPSPSHRKIVLVVDEFTSLIGQAKVPKASGDPDADIERDLMVAENQARGTVARMTGKIAREARSANVSLILATQKLTANMLDTGGISDIKTNLARLLLGKAGQGDMQAALRSPFDAPPLPDEMPLGRGLWEPVTAASTIVQVYYAPPGELASHLEAVRRPAEKPQAITAVPEPDDEDGGKVIDAGTLELDLDDLDDLDDSDDSDDSAPIPGPGPQDDERRDQDDTVSSTPLPPRPTIQWDDDLDWSSDNTPDLPSSEDWEFQAETHKQVATQPRAETQDDWVLPPVLPPS